ncbi:MAG: hypothetical protein WDW36_006224 [Sanguina aurantia]
MGCVCSSWADHRQSSERELTDSSVLPECNLPAAYQLSAQPAAKPVQQHLHLQQQYPQQQQQHSQTRQSHRFESGLPPSLPPTPEGRSKTLSAMATVLEGVASSQDQGRFPATRTRGAVPSHTAVFQSRDCLRSDYILTCTKAAVHPAQGHHHPPSSSTPNPSASPAHIAGDDSLVFSEGGDDDCVDDSHIDTSLTPSSLFERHRPRPSSTDNTRAPACLDTSHSALTSSHDTRCTRSSSFDESSHSRCASSHDTRCTQSTSFEQDPHAWATALGRPPPPRAAASDGTATRAASSSRQPLTRPPSFQRAPARSPSPPEQAATSPSLAIPHDHHLSSVSSTAALPCASAGGASSTVPAVQCTPASTGGGPAAARAALAASSFLYHPTGSPRSSRRVGAQAGGGLPGWGGRLSEGAVAVAPPHGARGGPVRGSSGGCVPIKEQPFEGSSRGSSDTPSERLSPAHTSNNSNNVQTESAKKQYVVMRTLGRGSFGKVQLCLNTADGLMYAVKVISRAHMRELQKQGSRALLLRKGRRSLSAASLLLTSTTPSATSVCSDQLATLPPPYHRSTPLGPARGAWTLALLG